MKTNITINDIDKVRAQALRWVKRSEKCRFEGMPFYLLRIGRCMKRLGFDYAVKEMTDATQGDCIAIGFVLWDDIRNPRKLQSYGIMTFRKELPAQKRSEQLSQRIVDACQLLADHLYEGPTPQPLP